jgi:hypothetical protein
VRTAHSIQFHLNLRDPFELDIETATDVVQDRAALIQDIDDSIELGA